MHRVQKSVLVPFAAQQMFDLVDAVERYPDFLPWCDGSHVLETHAGGKTARLDIHYAGIRAHFTTDNRNDPPASIVVTLKDGPFRHLHGEWSFRTLAPHASKVELMLAWEFKTHLLEAAVGPVFNRIVNTFVDAFVRRAEAVYPPSPPP
ncbi:MAG: type II toxin-antitoxin system RatA family toxin [Burkholderiales bacterium]